MRRPGQSGDDGSFGRSAGMQPGRGAALLVVAVLLGVVLLNAADDAPPARVAAGTSDETTTTVPAEVPTTLITLPPRPPADVKVISANGTDTKGVARKATDQLKAAGYNVLSPTDAAAKAAASNVYFVGDFQREAEAVAANLGLPVTAVQPFPTPPPLADARGATVVVVVGPELAQTLGGATTATTTGTTATSSATTTKP